MKVEIWSDIACPWCYIGKRRFESALEQFPESGNIDIEWKSFQLAPDLETDPMSNNLKYLEFPTFINHNRNLATRHFNPKHFNFRFCF